MIRWIPKIFRTATWGKVILRYQRLKAALGSPKPSVQREDGDYELSFPEPFQHPDLPVGGTTVEVRLPDGTRWGAALYTPEEVRRVLDEWRKTDGSSGLYFWAPGVVIVRDLDHDSVVALVDDLLAYAEFQKAFARLS
jgi:hypothetical protein